MKIAIIAYLLTSALCAQRIEGIVPGLGGRAVQDEGGNWIIAQSVTKPGTKDRDIRILKFVENPGGLDLTIGGSGSEDASGLFITPGGEIVLLGTTDSKDFSASPGVLWAGVTAPGNPSSFLVRIDSAGKVRTSTFVGAEGLSILLRGFASRPDGSLILGAEVRGTGVAKFGNVTVPGDGTLLVLETDAEISRVIRGVRLGASSTCNATMAGLQVNHRGDVYVAGSTCGDDFPASANAYLPSRPGGICFGTGILHNPFPCTSGVIARLDAFDLHVISATYLGGTAAAFIRGLALDGDGYPYVTGMAEIFPDNGGRGLFPTTRRAYQETVAVRSSVVGPESVFVTKLTPELDALVYSTFLDGSRSENPSSILVDSAGRAVIAGGTVSPDFPATGAFRTPCGPDVGLNAPQVGFVTRLDAEGRALSSSARLQEGYAQLAFMDNDRYAIAGAGDSLVVIDLDSGLLPSVACLVNGANFRNETYVAPNQIVTFFGANFAPDTIVLFDYLPARLLYVSPTQINAIVPPELSGSGANVAALIATGSAFSNVRPLSLRDSNPTVKVFVSSEGKLVDRGSPLADVRLSDGSSNSLENPAHRGEVVELYATGVNLQAPLEVWLGMDKVEVLQAFGLAGTMDSVQVLQLRIPTTCCGGIREIVIKNGAQGSSDNSGFVWIE